MKELYILSHKIKFIPNNKSIGWKEDSYLWMCELQRWLREKCNIDIYINSYNGYYATLEYNLINKSSSKTLGLESTYEEALEEELYRALELIKI